VWYITRTALPITQSVTDNKFPRAMKAKNKTFSRSYHNVQLVIMN